MKGPAENLFDALANEGNPTNLFGDVLGGPDYRVARDLPEGAPWLRQPS